VSKFKFFAATNLEFAKFTPFFLEKYYSEKEKLIQKYPQLFQK